MTHPAIHPSRHPSMDGITWPVHPSIHGWHHVTRPSIHPSRHPSMDGIIQGRKPWQK
jgi:hypothetical protein